MPQIAGNRAWSAYAGWGAIAFASKYSVFVGDGHGTLSVFSSAYQLAENAATRYADSAIRSFDREASSLPGGMFASFDLKTISDGTTWGLVAPMLLSSVGSCAKVMMGKEWRPAELAGLLLHQ
ncbi:hypothetical protein [Bradyrhizobium pachyrhizi]|uniref:hypothetical protein n=1 Tax=Bradyrhizobium pachyrhizi TaxID=280333 RepID=UPI0014289068|nr:hypothetical protein [Bradyrhizobium pachyrhizi]